MVADNLPTYFGMHQVEHYDFVISRSAEPPHQEVLLVAVDRVDVPLHLGQPKSARWVAEGDMLALEVLFAGDEDTWVRFAALAKAMAEPMMKFERVLVTWMDTQGVMGEDDIPLAA